MKRRTLLAAAATTPLALSGCINGSSGSSPGGDSSPGGAGSQAQAPTGPIKLTFSSYAFQDPTVKATQDIVDSWNKANPNVTVEYQKVDPNNVHDKLVTQFAGGSAPDIIHDEAGDLAGFSQQGYLAELSSLIPPTLKSDIPDSVWKSVTYGGKITGIPTIAQVYNLFVNTAMLQAAGITVPTAAKPWTWDDLQANAKKLTPGGDVYGFAWGLKSPTAGLMSTGLSFDGVFVSGDEAKPTMTVGDKEMEVPKRVKAMLDAKVMAPNSISLSGADVLPGFFGGKYATIMAGNYVATQITAKAPAGFGWTMIPLLKGTSQNQAGAPQTLSIARQSKFPQQAMAFIAHYMEAERLAKIAEGDALIPVSKAAAEIAKKDLGSTNGWDVILGSSSSLVDTPWNKATKFPQWKSEVATPAYQEFLAGKIDAAALQTRLGDGWKKINA